MYKKIHCTHKLGASISVRSIYYVVCYLIRDLGNTLIPIEVLVNNNTKKLYGFGKGVFSISRPIIEGVCSGIIFQRGKME